MNFVSEALSAWPFYMNSGLAVRASGSKVNYS